MKNKNHSMTITFNSSIYIKSSILESIEAFKHLADFNIEFKKDIFKVFIENIDEDIKGIIEGEFSNYVLSLMYKTL